MKINIDGIVVKNGVPYIRDTDVIVEEILNNAGNVSMPEAFKDREIISNHGNRVTITYADICAAKAYSLAAVLSK